MFAILLSDKMDPFYQNILSFPTVVFSALLVLCVLFWLVAILGFLDISFLDLSGGDMDIGDTASTPDAVTGLILRLGLNGVPLTIIITLIALIGWFICYYIVHFLFGIIPDGVIRYAVGSVVLVVTFYVSALTVAQLIRPLRKHFKGLEQNQDVEKLVLGQTAVVRTSKVDSQFGEAMLDDGGAGLILKVRATGGSEFKKDDRVVLIEYLEEANTFRVVSEQEFKGL